MELTGNIRRRELVGAMAAAVVIASASTRGSFAQRGTTIGDVQPQQVFEAGYRLASFLVQAAHIAARKSVPGQVAELAQRLDSSRQTLREELRRIGAKHSWSPPADLLEQRSILANLDPLDGLEFSRRYVETVQQALAQEHTVFAIASKQTDPDLRKLAAVWLAQLEKDRNDVQSIWNGLKT